MVVGCVTDECTVAVSPERLWKVAFDPAILPKVCPGFVDAVELDGDGGAGTMITMKLNPAVEGGVALKRRVLARNDVARVMKTKELEDSVKVGSSSLIKWKVTEARVVEAVDNGGSSVVKLKVEYETADGVAALSPEEEKKFVKGYFAVLKIVEGYLIAHPEEFA